MSKVPAKFIGLSTTIGIQQPIGTYGGQIYLQKWCQPMVFPDVLYWPINYYHRYLKTYRHLCYLQKWCQPIVMILIVTVFSSLVLFLPLLYLLHSFPGERYCYPKLMFLISDSSSIPYCSPFTSILFLAFPFIY